MTARRSEDADRDRSRDGADAAAYWTPQRRREARPAPWEKVPSPEPEHEEPEQGEAGTSGEASRKERSPRSK
ncbi:hypothetical protein [Brachybacterium sacelli]|uniref:Uncharacterized protein n=1 Tax=Brachybacterium sacelli TaxID=173364 RepID=A0ABS4X6G2_9MICO|nr:hypothetical protein [Brachybacterium sacelli]MBP2383921.1 hypothetical protein [Brachybacterium sacelli]